MKNRPPTRRNYPRMARVNELLREILGDALERLDDDRLELVTVTGVVCESDLKRAQVFYDSIEGEEGDELILEAFGEVRYRLQSAIGAQTRLKRTPELLFHPDLVLRSAAHIEDVLRSIPPPVASLLIDDEEDAEADDETVEATGAPAEDDDAAARPEADG